MLGKKDRDSLIEHMRKAQNAAERIVAANIGLNHDLKIAEEVDLKLRERLEACEMLRQMHEDEQAELGGRVKMAKDETLAGVMSFLKTVSENAEQSLSTYIDSLIHPGNNETAQIRLLAGRLREIGTSCKSIYSTYEAGVEELAVKDGIPYSKSESQTTQP